MIKWLFIFLTILVVPGCSGAGNNDYTAGDLRAKNHVAGQNINWFSVNGHRAPGLGGGYCCVMLPLKWTPDLKVRIEWEVDPDTASPFPGYQDREKYKKWEKEVKASYQKHSTVVDIPQYGKERCGISVHFLPCNQVKVTTVCEGYGTPTYPIKEPMNMKEPAQCPK
ncbi:DUF3304 domain-containing protein [Serratia quinivorans]|uniref:DUF3304 domain-containing protein n=1 Tax=Serratia quinivorans TaxID=137545 RepID=UPI00107EB231|nr:DUF3304 domain-containing protein [Serratia quinivorans]QBX65985.1 DUF3304 domain-containing protein [Serratia quinivorans]